MKTTKMIVLMFLGSICMSVYGRNADLALTARDPFSNKHSSLFTQVQNDLSSYDISQLEVLGSLQIFRNIYAVVSDPSGHTYKLQPGDEVDHGKVKINQISAEGMAVTKITDGNKLLSWIIPFPALRS